MLRLRVRTDAQARTKNGQPAPIATGVASRSSIQFERSGVSHSGRQTWPPMSRTTSGTASASANQSLRFMSISSSFGPPSADGVSGSSAMPQIGHEPGPSCRISGCIGQVKIAPAGASCSRDR